MGDAAGDEGDGGDGGTVKLQGRRGEHQLERGEEDSTVTMVEMKTHGRRWNLTAKGFDGHRFLAEIQQNEGTNGEGVLGLWERKARRRKLRGRL